MKTIPILIAMLVAGNALALTPDDPAYKDIERMTAEASKQSPIPSGIQPASPSTPSVTTIAPCGAGYQISTQYSDGHYDVSQAGPCGAGWSIIHGN